MKLGIINALRRWPTPPTVKEYFKDFIKNKVYYAVRQRLNLDEVDLNIPEADLRKLSLAGGLMARVAHVDREVTEDDPFFHP